MYENLVTNEKDVKWLTLATDDMLLLMICF